MDRSETVDDVILLRLAVTDVLSSALVLALQHCKHSRSLVLSVCLIERFTQGWLYNGGIGFRLKIF